MQNFIRFKFYVMELHHHQCEDSENELCAQWRVVLVLRKIQIDI